MVDISKKLVLFFMTGLGLVGVYVASVNLPVATGCRYYAECSNIRTLGEAIGKAGLLPTALTETPRPE